MSEGEVVEDLISQTSILLSGVGVFFTVLSVYLAGLNYVLSEESRFTKFIAFVFVSIALGMILAIMYGAQVQHAGLIGRLLELKAEGQLTAAGAAALGNYMVGFEYMKGHQLTIDEAVVYFVWSSAALTWIALIYLTFVYKWRPRALTRDIMP